MSFINEMICEKAEQRKALQAGYKRAVERFIDEMIREKVEQRKELQARYKRAVERSHEIRTMAIMPDQEDIRKKILARYNLEKTTLNREINDLGEEIWKLQKEREGKDNG